MRDIFLFENLLENYLSITVTSNKKKKKSEVTGLESV